VLPAAVAHAAGSPTKPVVSAWLPWWSITPATQSVVSNADLFYEASPFWFQATDASTIVVKPGAVTGALATTVSALHARGVKVVPSVTDAMAAATTAAMLSDPAARAAHENALMALVDANGLDGIDLDYENIAFASNATLAPVIRTGYVTLLTELAAKLHAKGKLLTVAVVAKTSDDASVAHQAYDYAAIGKVVDRVRIMTYDQNSQNSKYPGGPVSSVQWTNSVLQYAVSVIPASKVEMGVPLYGYDWSDAGGPAATVTYSQALALQAQYNAPRLWSAQHGAPYFTYTATDGTHHTVWYNDAQAVASRLPLIAKYNIAGVAFWSLGAEDPGIWQALRSYTYGPDPFGSFDAVSAVPGGALARGWAIDANSTDPIRVDFYVDGKGAASVTASTSRPDIGSLYFIYGDNHGFNTTIPLPAGNHSVCAFAINVGPGAHTSLGCRTVNVLAGSPFGNVDSVTGGLGSAQVRGWALDPDVADPIRVDFYVDGKGAASLTADGTRGDIGRLYPGWGSAHGFSGSIPVPGGTHQVCVFAINVGAGSHTSLGCHSVTVPTGNPYGNIDAVSAGVGTVAMRGWAIDPDVASPLRIDFYVDGKGATSVTADATRPDLAAAFPSYGANHGFTASLAMAGGTHQVCAYAINVGPGGSTKLGCRSVVMPTGSAKGNLDQVTRTDTALTVRGWALDPDIATPIRVDFYVDGKGAASSTADLARSDIGAAFPAYGPDHGFSVSIPVAAGTHQVCAYAINVGPGAANTKLGCQTA